MSRGGCPRFGPYLVPEESAGDAGEDAGAAAQTAFQIARTYLAAPRDSAGQYFLLAAAVAVARDTRKREQEEEGKEAATPAPA